uniref:hypothetical protein n=1 Tax=Flavobacterium sp. TaxID=239 RepID=UPI00404A73B3
MKNKIKILFYFIIIIAFIYEGYYYSLFMSNSHLQIIGSHLNEYESDFVFSINNKIQDTLNVNIPCSFSKGHNLRFGKNSIKLVSLDSTKNFETKLYFYGLFTWNIIEITPEEIIVDSTFSFPRLQ